ncbi:hypothetical protein ACFX1Z_004746 [Malus domestica]
MQLVLEQRPVVKVERSRVPFMASFWTPARWPVKVQVKKFQTGGVESDPRWWARELVVKTGELILFFDEVDGDGGGSEEGCGKRLMRRLELKSTTSRYQMRPTTA